jgi:hypothetical protein
MSLLEQLSQKETWKDFRIYKAERNQLSKRELNELDVFIEEQKYLSVTDTFSFGYPTKKTISKMGSEKKRTVYSYSDDETWVLKVLSWLLYRYDCKIPESCYSFRPHKTSKTAFDSIRKIPVLDSCFVLKADIHDYFNSINVDKLLIILHQAIDDDEPLYQFIEGLLTQDRCYYNYELITEKRGAMAGVPLASFLANIYLMDMDLLFEQENIPYYRYSDDIIIFCKDEEQLKHADTLMKETLKEKCLKLNMKKYHVSEPHQSWEFLGFSYHEGQIDLSDGTIEKMKGKIRRKAHSIYRWKKRNNADYSRAARSMIRSFDYKFYDLSGNNGFTWTRFYFPVITVSDGLHKIDQTMVQYLRYLKTGRHYKGNYEISYDYLKKLGYTSLVNEYYTWKKENEELKKSGL